MLLTNLRLSAACMLLTVACFGYYGPAARVLPAPTEMGLSCSAHQRWSVRYIVPHAWFTPICSSLLNVEVGMRT